VLKPVGLGLDPLGAGALWDWTIWAAVLWGLALPWEGPVWAGVAGKSGVELPWTIAFALSPSLLASSMGAWVAQAATIKMISKEISVLDKAPVFIFAPFGSINGNRWLHYRISMDKYKNEM
jgi:hypothetical protein